MAILHARVNAFERPLRIDEYGKDVKDEKLKGAEKFFDQDLVTPFYLLKIPDKKTCPEF